MTAFASTLVLGGARSGKSSFAEWLAVGASLARIYIATAQALDEEMRARISQHRLDRDGVWTTVEAPLDLAGALRAHASADRILLVDCLTLWLSNVILAGRDEAAEIEELVAAIRDLATPAIFVSNEVGLGIVPENALARRFRDAQGRLNQKVAHVLPRAVFIAAGLPLLLKGPALGDL
jgi:adenosylcobinamide kinase/adenosylcobinamide-phosphate guanylyltransferase